MLSVRALSSAFVHRRCSYMTLTIFFHTSSLNWSERMWICCARENEREGGERTQKQRLSDCATHLGIACFNTPTCRLICFAKSGSSGVKDQRCLERTAEMLPKLPTRSGGRKKAKETTETLDESAICDDQTTLLLAKPRWFSNSNDSRSVGRSLVWLFSPSLGFRSGRIDSDTNLALITTNVGLAPVGNFAFLKQIS